MKVQKYRYWTNDDGVHCPICGFDQGSCHIGSFCTNDKCPASWVDGLALLTPKQAASKKYKDIVLGPWQGIIKGK